LPPLTSAPTRLPHVLEVFAFEVQRCAGKRVSRAGGHDRRTVRGVGEALGGVGDVGVGRSLKEVGHRGMLAAMGETYCPSIAWRLDSWPNGWLEPNRRLQKKAA
jgi:hypothetical protein